MSGPLKKWMGTFQSLINSFQWCMQSVVQLRKGTSLGLVRVKCQQPQAWGVQGTRWLLDPRDRACHRDRAPAQICWLQVLGPSQPLAPVQCIPWAHPPLASCQFFPSVWPCLKPEGRGLVVCLGPCPETEQKGEENRLDQEQRKPQRIVYFRLIDTYIHRYFLRSLMVIASFEFCTWGWYKSSFLCKT